jgi:hypothetical protein
MSARVGVGSNISVNNPHVWVSTHICGSWHERILAHRFAWIKVSSTYSYFPNQIQMSIIIYVSTYTIRYTSPRTHNKLRGVLILSYALLGLCFERFFKHHGPASGKTHSPAGRLWNKFCSCDHAHPSTCPAKLEQWKAGIQILTGRARNWIWLIIGPQL